MRQISLLLTLLTLPWLTACAHNPPPIVLGLGPITAPASLQRQVTGPGCLSAALIATLPRNIQDAILSNCSLWEAALAQSSGQVDDALTTFADYNRHLPHATTR